VNGNGVNASAGVSENEGRLIVLTAPLTECIDHAGYFIQMAMASMPVWMERVMNSKYPQWRNVERAEDGSALYMPAGLRVLEAALLGRYSRAEVVACFPEDLHRFVGPKTRAIGVSTHNPLGVTFAAGVYTSIFGTSKQPINSAYARALFSALKQSPYRDSFKVIVGGSGGWQIVQTDSFAELGVDCVVEGRSESADCLDLFDMAIRGEDLPRKVEVAHPRLREQILVPEARTTFGVIEMTTGCGRRCNFCLPDLNPQIDVPKEKIIAAVKANVLNGNKQISLATEDMFIWGQVRTGVPFFFPNREALVDLYSTIVRTPGVEQVLLSHSTIAPAVVDPLLIKELSDVVLDKSPIHVPRISHHPKKKVLSPLVGLETGSVRLAKQLMPSKAVPFSIEDWPSVVLEGLRIMNENNWFPVLTLMVGNPGETDEDVEATLDLVYEMERRDLFAFMVPSVFTPLQDTRMAAKKGITQTRDLSSLQWQLLLKCWKMNLRPGNYSWWGPFAWRFGALILWLLRLRKLNGPQFTWPLLMFAGLLPEKWMQRRKKVYIGKPVKTKNRDELIATLRPSHRPFLRQDIPPLGPPSVAPSGIQPAGFTAAG
jgi:radical SAM superfamily enzyme YgiQ (UPF0313 family)